MAAAQEVRRYAAAARRRAALLAARVQQRRATRQLTTAVRTVSGEVKAPAGWQHDVEVIVSHRITSEDRLEMLRAVAARVAVELGDLRVPFRVADASDEEWHDPVAAAWNQSGLDVSLEHAAETLPAALLRLLRSGTSTWVCVQFDDMLTVGMARLVEGGIALVHAGLAPVACPMWAFDIQLDHERETIVASITREKRGVHRFWNGARRRPIAEVEAGTLDWGVFENPTYGFFVNHLVTRRDDLADRLEWFVDQVSATSAHRIELAAAAGRGPAWRHLAIPVAGAALFDLDFAHTDAAVRPDERANRRVVDAVTGGWGIEVRSGPGDI